MRKREAFQIQPLHVLAGIIILGFAIRWWRQTPVAVGIGKPLILGAEPNQEQLPLPLSKLITRSGETSRIELTHRFEVTGEALAVTEYTWYNDNPYFNVDLGLVWGPHVEAIKSKVKFRQSSRWLFWSFREPLAPAAMQEMERHFGNLHLMPAEGKAELAKAISRLRAGDKVRVKGHLIRIFTPSGTVVASSVSREDKGDGACEIILVDELQNGDKIYR